MAKDTRLFLASLDLSPLINILILLVEDSVALQYFVGQMLTMSARVMVKKKVHGNGFANATVVIPGR